MAIENRNDVMGKITIVQENIHKNTLYSIRNPNFATIPADYSISESISLNTLEY